MKSFLFAALSASTLLACAADTDTDPVTRDQEQGLSTELNWTHKVLPRGFAAPGGVGKVNNLTYHNGPTLTNAHVVPIFWGPSWTAGDASIASSIQRFVAAFGTSGEYRTITQYYSGATQQHIALSNLAGGDQAFFDSSTPPANVTDAAIQAEVNSYLSTHPYDANAIYEVFLPTGSYSSDGTSTSCGGPHLAYCAYHGNFSNGGNDIKYASMPYPSCGGCQTAGFTTAQNFEHFISHETREAVTDPDLNAWYDKQGNEADDKCAWSPTPTGDSSVGTNLDGSPFAFQYEWSNADSKCVLTK